LEGLLLLLLLMNPPCPLLQFQLAAGPSPDSNFSSHLCTLCVLCRPDMDDLTSVPPQLERMQRGDQAAAAAAAAAAGKSFLEPSMRTDSDASGSTYSSVDVQWLTEKMSDDVYAPTVKTIMGGVRGVRLAHTLLGLAFTVMLQLGMLCLLWYVVVIPGPDKLSKESEKLWTQVGQLQGQLCFMQNALSEQNISTANSTSMQGGCAGAWPKHQMTQVTVLWGAWNAQGWDKRRAQKSCRPGNK
jgi:hypothetical protein